jgi:hypothetical protein
MNLQVNSNYLSSNLKHTLQELDWDSDDRGHLSSSLNIIHWHPASFISNVPANLIEVFTNPGDLIWDPFCGSGVSGVEAIIRGRNFIGSDTSIISKMISNAKFTLLSQANNVKDSFVNLQNTIIKIQLLSEKKYEFSLLKELLKNNFSVDNESSIIYNHDELSRWYHHKVYSRLILLHMIIESCHASEEIKDVYRIVFLGIARVCCAQQKSWGHIADNMLPTEQQKNERSKVDPFAMFQDRVSLILSRVSKLSSSALFSVGTGKSLDACATSIVLDNTPNFVLTSPPYPWMCDYINAQRLSFYWLGFTVDDLYLTRGNEIGARYTRKSKSRGERYAKSMISAFNNILSQLHEDSKICLVYPVCDENKTRVDALNAVYSFLDTKMHLLCSFERRPEKGARWSPFVSLDKERITIWKLK